MPKTIDILTVMDPLGFANNNTPLKTPIDSVPMASVSTLNANVWMLGENNSVIDKSQGTWNLSVKASPGDTIRWWDTSVIQDVGSDMIIVGFETSPEWSKVLDDPQAGTKETGVAYIQSGFDFKTLANLQFTMNAFQNNHVWTKVKTGAAIGMKVTYHLIVAKLDVSTVGTPKLQGLYRFDPTITIVP